MGKWYNEKSNEEIIKKIEEIKGDVSAFAKESIDTSLSAMDKAQNARLEVMAEYLKSIQYGLAECFKEGEKSEDELREKLFLLKSECHELSEELKAQIEILNRWQHRMLALDVILFLFLLGLILFLNV